MKSSKKSFRRGLCTRTDQYYDDDIDYHYENPSQAVCCGIICAKSLAIIFNLLFIVIKNNQLIIFFEFC